MPRLPIKRLNCDVYRTCADRSEFLDSLRGQPDVLRHNKAHQLAVSGTYITIRSEQEKSFELGLSHRV